MKNRGRLWVIAAALLAAGPWGSAEAEYLAKGQRDPFVPLLTAEGERIHPPAVYDGPAPSEAGPRLEGVALSAGGISHAVINGRVLREGETFDGIRVLRIEAGSVTVERDGERLRLELPPEAAE